MDRETYEWEWKRLREMIREHKGRGKMFPMKIGGFRGATSIPADHRHESIPV